MILKITNIYNEECILVEEIIMDDAFKPCYTIKVIDIYSIGEYLGDIDYAINI